MPDIEWSKIGWALTPQLHAIANVGALDLAVRRSSAETVFQIAAEDEVRAFFPLSSILPGHGTEVICPGSHGDIGGSYGPEVTTDRYSNNDVNRYAFLRDDGWLSEAERTYWSDRHGTDRAGGWERTVLPGLGFACLHAMAARAHAVGVPIHDVTHTEMREDVRVPADLMALTLAMSGGTSLPKPQRDALRVRYSHRSWGAAPSERIDLHHIREVYPNRP